MHNGFYLPALGEESSFATDRVTELTFLSLSNEINSFLLPSQCSCTNWSQSQAARALFTGEVPATGRLRDTKRCGEQLESPQQPKDSVSESTRKRETGDLERHKA